MVVVDQSMEEYYGTNLENHILTLLFLVNTKYIIMYCVYCIYFNFQIQICLDYSDVSAS